MVYTKYTQDVDYVINILTVGFVQLFVFRLVDSRVDIITYQETVTESSLMRLLKSVGSIAFMMISK